MTTTDEKKSIDDFAILLLEKMEELKKDLKSDFGDRMDNLDKKLSGRIDNLDEKLSGQMDDLTRQQANLDMTVSQHGTQLSFIQSVGFGNGYHPGTPASAPSGSASTERINMWQPRRRHG